MAGSEDRLQQYFDGELTGEAAEAVRREIEDDTAVRAKLEGLAHLRTLIARAAEDRGDEIDSDALFAGITAKLGAASEDDDPMLPVEEEPAAPKRPALGVIPGGKVTGGKVTSGKVDAAPKTAKDVSHEKKKSNVVWIGTAAVLAAAAAVLLVVLEPFDGGAVPTDDPIAVAPPPGSEVVDVDFGYSTGAVFSVEGQEGHRYAVVWISDEAPIADPVMPPAGIEGPAPQRIQ